MPCWIDSHCHLDATEFAPDRSAVRARARALGVVHCVVPGVERANFAVVRDLAHANGDSYALGIHPLFMQQASLADLQELDAQLLAYRGDPRLVAVGEIGLDFFVPEISQGALRERQEFFYLEQLKLACKHDLPVILHVRRSADRLLRGLRAVRPSGRPWSGIAHAFAGSPQQAAAFLDCGLKLGFGGAMTFDRALQLRRLAARLPLSALVLETDAPDIPPQWLYRTAAQRLQGAPQGRNEPAELPLIAARIAALRAMTTEALGAAVLENTCAALPKLRSLLV